MIDRRLVECDYCHKKILMRFQMGYFDIPFNFCCPNCGVHIKGCRKITKENSFDLNCAKEILFDNNNIDYYGDFSVELAHTKIRKFISNEDIVQNGFSPFIMTSTLFNKKYLYLVNNMKEVISFRDNMWPKLEPLFDLFINKKIKLIREPLRNICSSFKVHSELDAFMSLHQIYILSMNRMLKPGALGIFAEVSKTIYSIEDKKKLDDFIEALGGREYFESIFKRLMKIYSRWLLNLEKYIPAIMISIEDKKDELDLEKFGIATTSFEDMKTFYSDSYELILDMIDIAVGLNNIFVRGSYDNFCETSDVKNFLEYRKKIKSKRTESLIENEPFSKNIPLERNIRNAIAHYNYDFDSGTQKIVFKDSFRGHNSTKEIYLIELAIFCYKNIEILMYLDELLYTLRKYDYGKSGMRVNIIPLGEDDIKRLRNF